MSFARLWAFLAVALPALAALLAGLSTIDLAYQLRAGAEILDGRGLPATDTWTFTAAGAQWVDQQWAAQVLLAAVYRVAGWTGLVVLRAALVAAIFGCLFEIGRRRGLGTRRSALLALAAFVVAAAALGLRPQLVGMALFALLLLLVSDRRSHPGRLWAVPVVVLLWANVHGSFFLGPAVLGLAWLEDVHDRVDRPHRALAVAVVAAVAACVTPFGPGVWAYAVGLSTNPAVTDRISEWQPTSLRDAPGLLFFGSVLAVVVLLARRGRSTPWPTLAWFGGFFAIGTYAARGIAWWPLGAVAAMVRVLAPDPAMTAAPAEPAGTPLMQRVNLALAGAIVLAAVALLPTWRPVDAGLGAPSGVLVDAPSGVTAALRDLARPGDRLLAPQTWGSWFEFALPGLPVAVDSRIEVIPARVWEDYDRVLAGQDGWQQILGGWKVTLVAAGRADSGLVSRLVTAGWSKLADDSSGLVFRAP